VPPELILGALRPLLELPVELVLLTHGAPTDRAALERAHKSPFDAGDFNSLAEVRGQSRAVTRVLQKAGFRRGYHYFWEGTPRAEVNVYLVDDPLGRGSPS